MIVRPRLRAFAVRHMTLVPLAFIAGSTVLFAADFEATPSEDAPQAVEASLPPAALRRVEAMARFATGQLEFDNDPDLAFQHFTRALEIDPSNAPLAQQVASIHLHRNEIPEALAVLKDALKQNPDSVPLGLRIASIYVISLRKFDVAIRYAQQALQASPDNIEPYQMLYSIYRADGNDSAVSRLLRQAENRNAATAEFQAGLADLYMRQQHSGTEAAGNNSIELALKHYRRAVELAQQDASILLRALNFFYANNKFDDAVTTARRIILLDPSDLASREKLALALAALGQDDDAIVELETIVAENPASLLAYRAHGEILLKRHEYAQALEKFEKALLLNDSDPRLYLEIVDICFKGNNFDRAIYWLSQARTKFSRLPELPYLEGRVLAQLNRWKEASNAFNMAADLAAQYQPAFLTADFYFQYGIADERSNNRAGAVENFRKCIDLDPNHTDALNYLGYMWAERGENLAEAETFIRRAVASQPDNPAFLDSLGWVLYQQGRYHEALAQLEKASQLSNPNDATIEEHRGDTLDKLGRHNEAIKAWNHAASLDGASPHLHAKLQAAQALPK